VARTELTCKVDERRESWRAALTEGAAKGEEADALVRRESWRAALRTEEAVRGEEAEGRLRGSSERLGSVEGAVLGCRI
jgi:hypothetical protein